MALTVGYPLCGGAVDAPSVIFRVFVSPDFQVTFTKFPTLTRLSHSRNIHIPELLADQQKNVV